MKQPDSNLEVTDPGLAQVDRGVTRIGREVDELDRKIMRHASRSSPPAPCVLRSMRREGFVTMASSAFFAMICFGIWVTLDWPMFLFFAGVFLVSLCIGAYRVLSAHLRLRNLENPHDR